MRLPLVFSRYFTVFCCFSSVFAYFRPIAGLIGSKLHAYGIYVSQNWYFRRFRVFYLMYSLIGSDTRFVHFRVSVFPVSVHFACFVFRVFLINSRSRAGYPSRCLQGAVYGQYCQFGRNIDLGPVMLT